MTLTIIGRCAKTNALGIALSSSPLSVTARCPFISSNLGAVSTQAYTDPGLGPLGIELLKLGYSPEKVISELVESDSLHEWRQIGVLDKSGRTAAYTGGKTMDHRGHICETNFVAMGNGLMSADVWPAMANVFKNTDDILENRLLTALEAGRDAGGDLYGHLSAGLVVHRKDPYPRTDLRVDMHLPRPGGSQDAVDELRRIFQAYRPMIGYYEDRPYAVDTIDEWLPWLINNDRSHVEAILDQLPERAKKEAQIALTAS